MHKECKERIMPTSRGVVSTKMAWLTVDSDGNTTVTKGPYFPKKTHHKIFMLGETMEVFWSRSFQTVTWVQPFPTTTRRYLQSRGKGPGTLWSFPNGGFTGLIQFSF